MAKRVTVGVDLALKLDDALLGRSGQQITAQTDKIAKTAGNGWAQQFARAGQVDPTKLVNTAQFAQEGQKAGKAAGNSAAKAIRQGDWAGAGTDAFREFNSTFTLKTIRPKVDTSQMQRDGGSAGDNFADGFASAGGLARLAGRGGPIAGAIIAAGATAIKVVKPMIEEAMQFEADVRINQARLGIDSKQMQSVTKAATDAWAHNFGESIAANMSTAVTAVQAGLTPDTKTIESLSTISTILGVEIPEAARSAGQLIRTGLADNAQQAFDIIMAGQREGLDVSKDWLDSIDEYSTIFRKLGLTGADVIGLIKQGLQGGARDTDKMADALKEIGIRAVDGSKQTTQAFEALGFNATDIASKFAQGGQVARDAFGQVTDRIRGIQDPLVQSKIAVALMGTQAEDLGAAFKKIDLSTAAKSIKDVQGATQNAADTALKTSQSEWQQAGRNIEAVWTKVKQSMNLGDLFSGIPKAFNELFANAPKLTPGAPGVPITGPRLQGPGIQGGINLPITGAPGATGGNPLDILRGGLPGGVDYKSWYPAAAPPPAPTAITPNALVDPALADSGGGGDKKLQLPTLPFTGPSPQEFLQQNGVPLTSSTYGAAQSVLEAQQRIAQLQSDVTTLEKANVDDQGDLVSKRNELVKAQQEQTKSLLSFQDSARNAVESFNKTMGTASDSLSEIGAGLDADLGISKGLPGLADNLVRFLANLATAPIQGVLSRIAQSGNNSQNSSVQGYAQYGMPSYGGGNVDAMMALAQSSSGNVKYGPASDMVNGLADCSGSISDLVEVLNTGQSSPARLFDTTAFATDAGAAKLGFLPGNMPGALNVGVNPYPGQSGHMAATLPNGVNFEGGGGTGGGAQYGGSAAGALDPQFEKQYYRPVTPFAPQPGSAFGNLSMPAPMTSAELNANPALTNPALTPGLPAPGTFPGGGSMLPGAGMPQAFGQGGATPSYSPTTPATQAAPNWQSNGGGLGIGGGLLGMAMAAGSSAAGMMPGGQVAAMGAQMGLEAINKTIAFGGEVAAIGAQGLMDAFSVSDPDGGGNSGQSSWLTRIIGGLASARPAGAANAGKADDKSKVDPNAPQNQQGQQPGGPQQTNHISIAIPPDRAGNAQQLANDVGSAMYNAHINPGG